MRDVIIIGGGIIGVCTAWYLQEAGMRVTIVDKGDYTDGCSFGNAGMLVPSHFTPLASPGMMAKGIAWMFKKASPFYIRPRLDFHLLQWLWLFNASSTRSHVENCASLLRDMHEESREMYRHWSRQPGFAFDFDQRGILMLYQTAAAEREELDSAGRAHALGMEANVLTAAQVERLEPNVSLHIKGGVHYPGDAHLSPDLFMRHMIHHLQATGVDFVSNAEVTGIHDLFTNGCEIELRNGKMLQARNIVIACGAWSGRPGNKMGMRLPMQDGKGYSFTLDNPDRLPRIPSLLHEARVAITPMGGRLRVSGTLEISGLDDVIREHKVRSIVEAVPKYYPDLRIDGPRQVWFGYRPCTPDGMPYIGRWKEDSSIIVASGHSMMGLSLAPATGRLVRDTVLGRAVTHEALNPSRFQ